MRYRVAVLLGLLVFLLSAVAFASNYDGGPNGGGSGWRFCNSSANGMYAYDPTTGYWRCGFAYDPVAVGGHAVYYAAWGFLGSCPREAPYYGYCWRWKTQVDVLLWFLVVSFVGWELFAHFVARNRSAHTLSNRVWWLEKRYPKTRFLVVVACLVLLTHLAFRVP